MKNVTSAPAGKGGEGFGIGSRVALATALAAVLVVGCGGWAATAQLSGAVIAPGVIAVKKQVKQIQHRDGGIVREIHVSNGDRVEEGDVLITLDETQTRAELGIIRSQLAELTGRRARLVAEREGAREIAFPEGFADDPLTADVAAGEMRLFASNIAMRESQKEQLRLQAGQLDEQIKGFKAQQRSNEEQRRLLLDEFEGLRGLLDKKLIEAPRVRAMERDIAKADGLRGELDANIARALGQISEINLKILALDQGARMEAQREIRDIEAKVAELTERRIAAQDRLSRMDLRAPRSGFVNELSVHTLGGVIAPGETVMSIVPDGDELAVEVRLSPADIDQVFVGQEVKLRFSAFNQRTTPEVAGEVAIVAAAATRDPFSGQNYYLGDVRITGSMEGFSGKRLVPGMPVEVFVSTGERSALSYLVKPFTDQASRAFREE